MTKEQEPKYYKAECGCVLQECGNLWKWVYDCKVGWVIKATMHKEYPFDDDKKILITKAEVAILKMLGKQEIK
jgi:hypothetical protein